MLFIIFKFTVTLNSVHCFINASSIVKLSSLLVETTSGSGVASFLWTKGFNYVHTTFVIAGTE